MALIDKRLALIREGVEGSKWPLFLAPLRPEERKATRQALDRRQANYVLVTFKDNSVIFLLSDTQYVNRANQGFERYAPD